MWVGGAGASSGPEESALAGAAGTGDPPNEKEDCDMAPMARGGPTVGIVLTIPTADNLRFEDTPATEAGLSSGNSQITKAYHGYI